VILRLAGHVPILRPTLAVETLLHSEIVPTAAVSPYGVSQAVSSFPGVLVAVFVVLASISVRGHWMNLKSGEVIWTMPATACVDVFSLTAAVKTFISKRTDASCVA